MSSGKAPSNLLLKLANRLFDDPTERDRFLECLLTPQSFPSSIVWMGDRPEDSPFICEPPLAWQPTFVDRLSGGQAPGKHEWHEQGCYYCLDFSSVFAASVSQVIETPMNLVVDVCASPGGKSIFTWRAFKPQRLLSNEVIGKRMGALVSNLKRCRIEGAIALRLDSQVLAAEIPKTADLVLVDAPCSGQSLEAKGSKAPGCFHPITIKNNANRQKRILANSAQVVAPGGYLIYMTCTYSPEENEQVSEWFQSRFPQFRALEVPVLQDYRSRWTDLAAYRMMPQSGLGAGAFTILFQNTEKDIVNSLPESFAERYINERELVFN